MENKTLLTMVIAIACITLFTGCNSSKKDWEKALKENSAEAYAKYLKDHPL